MKESKSMGNNKEEREGAGKKSRDTRKKKKTRQGRDGGHGNRGEERMGMQEHMKERGRKAWEGRENRRGREGGVAKSRAGEGETNKCMIWGKAAVGERRRERS